MSDYIINDDNFQDVLAPVQNGDDVHRGLNPRDFAANPVASSPSAKSFDSQFELIGREEWPERCADMVGLESRLSDIRNTGDVDGGQIPALDQNGQGFCWAYSTAACVQLLRAVMGLQYVKLSPHAVACKIFNFEDRGAWGAMSMEFMSEHGIPDVNYWAAKSMQRHYDNPETWENAKKYKITEGFIDLDVSHPADADLTFDETATLLLSRIPVVCDYNWWGHSVCGMDLVDLKPNLGQQGLQDRNRWGVRILNSWRNSWGVDGTSVLQGNKAIPDGGCSPRAVAV